MKQGLFYFLVGLLVTMTVVPVQAAGFAVTSPTASDCIAGGATKTVTITTGGGVNYAALAYRADGSKPDTFANSPSSYMASDITASYSWLAPNTTVTQAQIWADGYTSTSDHTSLGQVSSGVFSIDANPPTAPVVSIAAKTDSSVTLNWTASTDTGCATLTGYKIFRDQDANPIATVNSDILTYTDATVKNGTTYSYKVQAYDAVTVTNSTNVSVTLGASASPSPTPNFTPTATTAPASDWSITNVKVTDIHANQARVTWDTNQDASTIVYYGSTTDYGKRLADSTLTQKHSIVLTDLLPSTTYHYLVFSRNANNDLKQGNDATFKTSDASTATPTPTPAPQPIMKLLEIDNQNVALNYDAPLRVKSGQVIHIEGLARPHGLLNIHVFSQERIYELSADATGHWSFDLKTRGLEDGAHVVTVSNQNPGDNDPSQRELFRFLIDSGYGKSVAQQLKQSSPVRWFLILIIVAAIVTGIWYSLHRHRHHKGALRTI